MPFQSIPSRASPVDLYSCVHLKGCNRCRVVVCQKCRKLLSICHGEGRLVSAGRASRYQQNHMQPLARTDRLNQVLVDLEQFRAFGLQTETMKYRRTFASQKKYEVLVKAFSTRYLLASLMRLAHRNTTSLSRVRAHLSLAVHLPFLPWLASQERCACLVTMAKLVDLCLSADPGCSLP